MIENTAYLKKLAEEETDPDIKAQLSAILTEESAGERPGDNTPQPIMELFRDGYLFCGEVIKQLSASSGGNPAIVDLCCGEGKDTLLLGKNVIGIDLIENDLDHTLQDNVIYPEKTLVECDVVTWLQGIEHFHGEDQNTIINNIKDFYNPKYTIISTINEDCDPWVSDNFILTGKYNPYHIKEFGAFDFAELAVHFDNVTFVSQYWDDRKGSAFVPGLVEDAINFYLIGVH